TTPQNRRLAGHPTWRRGRCFARFLSVCTKGGSLETATDLSAEFIQVLRKRENPRHATNPSAWPLRITRKNSPTGAPRSFLLITPCCSGSRLYSALPFGCLTLVGIAELTFTRTRNM